MQLTGINAFFSQMGGIITIYQQSLGQFFPVLTSIVQFVAALYSLTWLPKANRKKMILAGNLGMALCCLGFGLSFYYQKDFPEGFWIIFGLSFAYVTLNGSAIAPYISLFII